MCVATSCAQSTTSRPGHSKHHPNCHRYLKPYCCGEVRLRLCFGGRLSPVERTLLQLDCLFGAKSGKHCRWSAEQALCTSIVHELRISLLYARLSWNEKAHGQIHKYSRSCILLFRLTSIVSVSDRCDPPSFRCELLHFRLRADRLGKNIQHDGSHGAAGDGKSISWEQRNLPFSTAGKVRGGRGRRGKPIRGSRNQQQRTRRTRYSRRGRRYSARCGRHLQDRQAGQSAREPRDSTTS